MQYSIIIITWSLCLSFSLSLCPSVCPSVSVLSARYLAMYCAHMLGNQNYLISSERNVQFGYLISWLIVDYPYDLRVEGNE